ncbi:uncharacterized protein LOC119917986 [Micropterus salmoides]|uniref:uncharacterized protein LOC119917986 n=1 Tax=Micropterus salmoides TaxID=27706 RepID=UPI0018ECDE78|nr:uncharacterized protein LOC119917986 [Micropterus salmoides]
MQYQWAEDDFSLPYGVNRLGLSEPVSGNKYIMYHGTTRQNAQSILATGFQQSEDGMLGRGVYLSRDVEKARRYPIGHPECDKVVIRVLVNVGQVIAINFKGHPRQKTWHAYGYDTAWVPPGCGMVKSGLEEDCVWDPCQIQIIDTINPRPVQPYYGCGPYGYMGCDSDTSMNQEFRGKKYIMYHGTTRKNAEAIESDGFRQSKDGMLGRGVYLSRDVEKASCYPHNHPESDKVVIVVKVSVGRVKKIDYQGHPLQKTWHDHGYNTAWVPPGSDTNMQYQWAEDDCILPPGVCRLDGGAPDCGKTYIMYHGTTRQKAQSILATGFQQSADGMLGRGVYLSRDLQKASCYPINHPECDNVVIRVLVNVGQVISITYQGHPRQKTWHDCRYGPVYDTAWMIPRCEMVPSVLQDCVWDPCRIQIIDIINPCPIQVFPGCVPCVYTGC